MQGAECIAVLMFDTWYSGCSRAKASDVYATVVERVGLPGEVPL
jgi:hypothetical protein